MRLRDEHAGQVECSWIVMAHAQKPDFVFRRNGQVYLNRQGRQFSRLLAAEVWASVVAMLDIPFSEVVWRILATHSIRQFPLYFPSRASPCTITFQLESTTLPLLHVHGVNRLSPELNPICYLLALLAHNFLHISRIRVKSLTLRLLMSYIYGAPIIDVSRSYTRFQQVSGLRPLTCWNRGFESHRGHGYLSVVSVVCCQVEVSATSWSLDQGSPTDCAASLCVI